MTAFSGPTDALEVSYRLTDGRTDTQTDYSNPRCACAPRVNEVELVICNGRQFVLEPERTRVRPSIDQKSVIDFIVTDVQLMRKSGEVNVDSTDIRSFSCWVRVR